MEPCGADGVLLHLRPERPLTEGGAPLAPNRFFMLRREDELSPAIPRPFSIYREVDGSIVFLVKVIGKGTRALADTAPGTKLRLVGPLGLGWPDLTTPGDPWVFLAGGGPLSMLRAAQAWATERDLECWASLEELMGCGVGICNGCVVETNPDGELGDWPNVKACVEGPAFRCDTITL